MVNSSAEPQTPITLPTEVVFEKQLTQFTQLFRLLRQAGLSSDDFQKPIDDPEMRKRLVCAWIAGVPENGISAVPTENYLPTPSQIRAREIMGRNYLGIEEVVRHFGVAYTEEQLAALAEVPFSEAVLGERENTHVLIAGFPMTILDVRAKTPSKKPKMFRYYKDMWYDSEAFAKSELVEVRWYLICGEMIAGSTSKTYDEQRVLLSKQEEVPWACELVYAVVLYFMATGERLFPNIYVRTSSVDSVGRRVFVGDFGSIGFSVGRDWGTRRGIHGVASTWKSE